MNINKTYRNKINKERSFLEKELLKAKIKLNVINEEKGSIVISLDSKETMNILLNYEGNNLKNLKNLKRTCLISHIEKKIKIDSSSLIDFDLNAASEKSGNKINFDLVSGFIDYVYTKKKEELLLTVSDEYLKRTKECLKNNKNVDAMNDDDLTKLLGIANVINGSLNESNINVFEDFIFKPDFEKALFELNESYDDFKTVYVKVKNVNLEKKMDEKQPSLVKDILLNGNLIGKTEKSKEDLKKLLNEEIESAKTFDKSSLIYFKESLEKSDLSNSLISEVLTNSSVNKDLGVELKDALKLHTKNMLEINGILNYKDNNDYLSIYIKDKLTKNGIDEDLLIDKNADIIKVFSIASVFKGSYLNTKNNEIEEVLLSTELKKGIDELPETYNEYKESYNSLFKTKNEVTNKKRKSFKNQYKL